MLLPLWNAWYFLQLYANAASTTGSWRTDSTHVLDRYILAKTARLVDDDHRGAGRLRHRRRLRRAAAVLRRADQLVRAPVARRGSGTRTATPSTPCTPCSRSSPALAAPLLPLVTEVIWRGLTGGAVGAPDRLARAPTSCPPTPSWSRRWTRSATVCSTALALRKAQDLRVRLPLLGAHVAAADAERLAPFAI